MAEEFCKCDENAVFIKTEFGIECQTCGNYSE